MDSGQKAIDSGGYNGNNHHLESGHLYPTSKFLNSKWVKWYIDLRLNVPRNSTTNSEKLHDEVGLYITQLLYDKMMKLTWRMSETNDEKKSKKRKSVTEEVTAMLGNIFVIALILAVKVYLSTETTYKFSSKSGSVKHAPIDFKCKNRDWRFFAPGCPSSTQFFKVTLVLSCMSAKFG